MIIIIAIVVFVLSAGNFFRMLFLGKAEKMSEKRTVNSIQGREIIQRMLAEENITDVEVRYSDFIVPRFYYNPWRKRIIVPTLVNFNSGLYDVMRCGTMASHAIFSKVRGGGLYYRLSPIMEVWSRIMPFFIIFMLYLSAINLILAYSSIAVMYLLSVVVAFVMRRTESEAVANTARWLVKNGIVLEEDSAALDGLTRYIANYNFVNVLMSGFAIASARRGMINAASND